jgi:hypothetical protein
VPDPSVCPHCGRRLAEVEAVNREHIISESLGGRTTLPACKPCNDAVSRVEGAVLAPNGLLALLGQTAGRRGKLTGTLSNGLVVDADFTTGRHRVRPQVIETTDNGVKTIRIGGDPGQVEKIVAGLRARYGDQLGEPVRHAVPAGEMINVLLNDDVRAFRRLLAKCGLTAGTYVWGDDFTLSPLANWLRQVLDARSNWPDNPETPVADPGGSDYVALSGLQNAGQLLQTATKMFAGTTGDIIDASSIGPTDAQILLLSSGKATFIALSVFGQPIPFTLVAPESLPTANVVLLRQRRGSVIEVHDLMGRVMAMAVAAEAAMREENNEG